MPQDKIVHFIHSDSKFNKSIINAFEEFLPGKNVFFITNDPSSDKHIQNNDSVLFCESQKEEDIKIIEQKSNEGLFAVFHVFVPQQLVFYNIVKKKMPVVWCSFGFDFLLFRRDALTIRTWLFYFMSCPFIGISDFINRGYLGRIRHKEYVKAANQIKFFGCIIPGEYKKAVSSHKKVVEFAYHVGYKRKKNTLRANGNNILLAHSGSIFCNHIEGLSLFKKYSMSSQRAVMYLSYGSNPQYTRSVIKIGKKTLNGRLTVYDSFLSREEYQASLLDCSYAILPYLRQLGLGCINLLLIGGTKIFFYKKSIVYQYYIANGFFVYSIEDDLMQDTRFVKLTDDEVSTNQQKCLEIFGEQATKQAITELYNFFWR